LSVLASSCASTTTRRALSVNLSNMVCAALLTLIPALSDANTIGRLVRRSGRRAAGRMLSLLVTWLPGATGLESADLAVARARDGGDQLAVLVDGPRNGVTELDRDGLARVREAEKRAAGLAANWNFYSLAVRARKMYGRSACREPGPVPTGVQAEPGQTRRRTVVRWLLPVATGIRLPLRTSSSFTALDTAA
jgi:hypothetical protein